MSQVVVQREAARANHKEAKQQSPAVNRRQMWFPLMSCALMAKMH